MASATMEIAGQDVKPSGALFSKRLNKIIILAAGLIILDALLNQSIESRANRTLEIGDAIPQFSLTLISGKTVSERDFAGNPTLYVFYAGWCPCSHRSVAPIQQAYEEGRHQGLQVFFIGIQDTSAHLEKFARDHDLTFDVAARGGESVANALGVRTTPTTLFVDREGVIRSVFVGRVDRYDQLAEGLESILAPGGAAA